VNSVNIVIKVQYSYKNKRAQDTISDKHQYSENIDTLVKTVSKPNKILYQVKESLLTESLTPTLIGGEQLPEIQVDLAFTS